MRVDRPSVATTASGLADHSNPTTMQSFIDSSVAGETAHCVSVIPVGSSTETGFFSLEHPFLGSAGMSSSASLEICGWLLWFVQKFGVVLLFESVFIALTGWPCLREVSGFTQSTIFIQDSSGSGLPVNKSDPLIDSSIVYAETMWMELIWTLHTLTCLLVPVYSTKIPFHVQFRSDFILFSFGMCMYETLLKICMWLRSEMSPVQPSSEVTFCVLIDKQFCM